MLEYTSISFSQNW